MMRSSCLKPVLSSLIGSICRAGATGTAWRKEGASVHRVSVLFLCFRVKPDLRICVNNLHPSVPTGSLIITKQSSTDAHRSEAATALRTRMTQRWRTRMTTSNGVLRQNFRVWWIKLESTDLTKAFHSSKKLLILESSAFFSAEAKFCLKMFVGPHWGPRSAVGYWIFKISTTV